MAAIVNVLLYCDSDPCPHGQAEETANWGENHHTKSEARAWAKDRGWSFSMGKDYCADCTKDRKSK